MHEPPADKDSEWLPDLEGATARFICASPARWLTRAPMGACSGRSLAAPTDLAQRLGVDLTTVTRAFAEARRRNLIDAAPGEEPSSPRADRMSRSSIYP
jgi:hypothetical protein